jgi:hypothetical protein
MLGIFLPRRIRFCFYQIRNRIFLSIWMVTLCDKRETKSVACPVKIAI